MELQQHRNHTIFLWTDEKAREGESACSDSYGDAKLLGFNNRATLLCDHRQIILSITSSASGIKMQS